MTARTKEQILVALESDQDGYAQSSADWGLAAAVAAARQDPAAASDALAHSVRFGRMTSASVALAAYLKEADEQGRFTRGRSIEHTTPRGTTWRATWASGDHFDDVVILCGEQAYVEVTSMPTMAALPRSPSEATSAAAARAVARLDESARTVLLAKCQEAAEAVTAAFDAPTDPGAELALEVRNLLGALVMLESWGKPLDNSDPCRCLAFGDFGSPEMVAHVADGVLQTARGVVARRSAVQAPWPSSMVFAGAARAFQVTVPSVDESPEHVRLRRAAATDRASIDWIHARPSLTRSRCGGVQVTMEFFVPDDVEPAGDLGGRGDRLIAEAARQATREAEPEKVVQALASMVKVERAHQGGLLLGCMTEPRRG